MTVHEISNAAVCAVSLLVLRPSWGSGARSPITLASDHRNFPRCEADRPVDRIDRFQFALTPSSMSVRTSGAKSSPAPRRKPDASERALHKGLASILGATVTVHVIGIGCSQ